MTIPRIRIVCDHCGSEAVTRDACAQFDEETQEWALTTVYDNADCSRCEGEANLVVVPFVYDPWAFGRPLHRLIVDEFSGEEAGICLYHYTPHSVRGDAEIIETFETAEAANEHAKTFAKTLKDIHGDVLLVQFREDYP